MPQNTFKTHGTNGQLTGTYDGITRWPKDRLHCETLLGLVLFEGDLEVWFLDSRDAAREVVRFYMNEYEFNARCMIAKIDGFHSGPSVPDSSLHSQVCPQQ